MSNSDDSKNKQLKLPHGGKKGVAEMLNHMNIDDRNQMIENLRAKDPELVREILDLMFTFEDLSQVNDSGVQALIKETPTRLLATALRKAPEAVESKIFGNLSARAKENLKEEVESLGPQKLSTVQQAQKDIVEIARRLESEGKLAVIQKSDDDDPMV